MANHVKSSGVLTTNTAVAGGRNYVSSVIAGGDGTNVATISIYDGTSTGGLLLLTLYVKAGDRQAIYNPPRSIQVDNGIFASVSGTGANVQVCFGA